MQDPGEEMSGEWLSGAVPVDACIFFRIASSSRPSPLIPVSAFLFCTLHRVEIPHLASNQAFRIRQ
jgi:hypothetical protein